ncbi:MAG TPA: PAS domain S-box protein [Anaerolineae bacterium]|nr:PAS domain S-box protein [Anaerolineae bacterium]
MNSLSVPRIWDRLGGRLFLTISLFLLVLALATAMAITVGFRLAQRDVERHALDVLEDRARRWLLHTVEREAGLLAGVPSGEMAAYLEALEPAPGGAAFVVLEDWSLVPPGVPFSALPNLAATNVIQRGRTAVEEFNADGRDLFLAYAPVPGRDWVFAIAVPREELVGSAAGVAVVPGSDALPTVWLTLAVMALLFLVALVATVVLSHHSLARPIETLAAGTRAIAGGNLDVRLPVRSRDELGALAASFNAMAERLAAVDRQLGQEIEEHRAAERSLREKEAQYRDVLYATSDGLLINDLDGAVVEANPAFCAMHGYAREELIGVHTTTFVHPDYHPLVDEYLHVRDRQEPFQAQAVDVRKDGSVLHVEVHATPFVWRGRPHVLAVVRDVSERTEARQMLEQRVAARTRELSALYDVTAVASTSLDLDTVLERSLDRVLDVMACQAGGVHLVDEAPGSLRLAAWRSTTANGARDVRLDRLTGRLVQRVLDRGESLVVPDVSAYAPGLDTGPHTYVGAPVHAKGQVLGVLSVVGRPDRRFGAEEVALLASIADQVGVAVENARLHASAAQLAVVQERERLARDLHDSVTQALYSANLMVETTRRAARDGALAEVERALGRMGEVVHGALKEMRLLVHELRPAILEEEGLVAALQKRLDAVEGRAGVEARLLVEGDVDLPPDAEVALYRIAQEALNNALKHAAASSVVVRLSATADKVLLEVSDDGCGFGPGAPGESGGMGLETMRQRAERLGSRLAIDSAPGEGTMVRVEVRKEAAR